MLPGYLDTPELASFAARRPFARPTTLRRSFAPPILAPLAPHVSTTASPLPHSWWQTAVGLWRLGRYRFLAGGFVLYALGAALARATHALDPARYALGQAIITATQLMTHYSNDYFDLEADAANPTPTRWSGGSRVLPDGGVSPALARNVALGCGAVAGILACVLAWRGHTSPGTLIILVVAIVLSWEYSAPPLRLHSRGLGPLTAAIVVGGLTPLAGYGVQGGRWLPAIFASMLPVVIAQFALVLILDFPDAVGDSRTGKRTLVVMLGRERAIVIALLAIALTYVSLPILVGMGGGPLLALGVAGTLPIGAWLAWTLRSGSWRNGGPMKTLAFEGVLWFVAVSLAELVAVLVAPYFRWPT
jgi:1,4-dihydroxy-2-naphthoate octaprenyltransferase